jgi:hypothetical protein
MSFLSTSFIIQQSTELNLINTSVRSGTIDLPPVSSLLGRILTFKDSQGTWGQSSFTLSTVGLFDKFEDGTNLKTFQNLWGATTLYAGTNNRWYILGGTQFAYGTTNELFTTFSQSQSIETNLATSENIYLQNSASNFQINSKPFFSPSMLADVRLWIDALSPETIDLSGDEVINITDKSGSGNNLSNGFSFTYNVEKFNGIYPSFFNRLGSALLGANETFICPQPFTFCVVGEALPTNDLRTFFDRYNSIGVSVSSRVHSADSQIYMEAGTTVTSSNQSTSVPFIFIGNFNSNASQGFYNGIQTLYGNVGTNSLSSIAIGNFNTSNRRYRGYIAEMIFVGGVMNIQDRINMEGYFAYKWGLTELLPSDHPSRTYNSFFSFGSNIIGPTQTQTPLFLRNQSLFQPNQIAGLTVWYDAADSNSLDLTGNLVNQWLDKSGNANNPVMNGTIIYNSSTRSVNTTGSPSFFSAPCDLRKTTTQYCSIFLVYQWLSFSDNQALWGTDQGGGWNRFQLLSFPLATSLEYGLSRGATAPNVININSLNTPSRVVYSVQYANTITNGSFAFLNGSQEANFTEVDASPQTATTSTFFGQIGDNLYYSQVAFHEIIIFRSEISALQRQQVEGYLAWKWGLVGNLPSDHPYKNAPP